MLEERYQRGGYTEYLLRRYVHVLNLVGRFTHVITAESGFNLLINELTFIVEPGASLGDGIPVFLVRRKVDNLIGHERHHLYRYRGKFGYFLDMLLVYNSPGFHYHGAFFVFNTLPDHSAFQPVVVLAYLGNNLPVRSLYKTIPVYTTVSSQRTD